MKTNTTPLSIFTRKIRGHSRTARIQILINRMQGRRSKRRGGYKQSEYNRICRLLRLKAESHAAKGEGAIFRQLNYLRNDVRRKCVCPNRWDRIYKRYLLDELSKLD